MPISAPSHVELLYEDSSATAGNTITAGYSKMSANNGALTLISTAVSDSGATTTGTAKFVTTTFSDTYDANNYKYYVHVILSRTLTTNTVSFYGVGVY